MKKVLPFICRIERQVYPVHMRQMQHIRDTADLADYCECRLDQLLTLSGEDWYLIAAERGDEVEIVDFASLKGCTDIFKILVRVVPRWRGRRIVLDARASTSYRLVLALVKRYKIQVVEDEMWHWGDEEMHHLVLQL